MILIDSNVFMYAAGAPHQHKADSAALLHRIARGDVDACVDAEVLQEILHRYRSLRRWAEGQRLFDLVRRLVPTVLPVTGEVMDDARRLLGSAELEGGPSARDAVHAAVARLSGTRVVCSYDRDLDGFPGVRRVEPSEA